MNDEISELWKAIITIVYCFYNLYYIVSSPFFSLVLYPATPPLNLSNISFPLLPIHFFINNLYLFRGNYFAGSCEKKKFQINNTVGAASQ